MTILTTFFVYLDTEAKWHFVKLHLDQPTFSAVVSITAKKTCSLDMEIEIQFYTWWSEIDIFLASGEKNCAINAINNSLKKQPP